MIELDYKITIPKGFTFEDVTPQINGSQVILTCSMQRKCKLKEGDVIVITLANDTTWLGIYRFENTEGLNCYCVYCLNNQFFSISTDSAFFKHDAISSVRLAAKSEQNQLANICAEHKLIWNDVCKTMDIYRWRAKLNETYYYIHDMIVCDTKECNSKEDDRRYSFGNYFSSYYHGEVCIQAVSELLIEKTKVYE